MNNTSDLADLIFTGKTSDIPAPQIYRLALRWTLQISRCECTLYFKMDASDHGSATALEEFDELELDSDFDDILAAFDDEDNIQVQFSEAVSEVSDCKFRKFAFDNRGGSSPRCAVLPNQSLP